jgi:AbrB family looped-hinge helix DNA binding protein
VTESTLSTKNQVVIPKAAREALGVKAGDKLLFVVRGAKVIVLQKPDSPNRAILGLGRSSAKPVYRKRYLEKERRSWE